MQTNQAIESQGASSDDSALALSAQQLDALAKMREIGMAAVEAIGKLVTGKATEAEKTAFAGADIALAFHRASRAVRQIIAMEQEIAGLRETRRQAIIGRRKNVAQKTMARVIKQAAYKEGIETLSVDRKILEACRDYDDYDDYDRGTQAEIVTRLCKTLGIENPDLSIWQDDVLASPDDADAPISASRKPYSQAWRDIPDATSPIWRKTSRGPPS